MVRLFIWIKCICCPLLIPVGIAVVAVAPAGHSALLQPSGSGHQVDLGVVGLLVESESGSARLAELAKIQHRVVS